MNLVATAEMAQDVASGLNKFVIPVEESASEIIRLISECFAISSVLRDMAAAIRETRHSHYYSMISDDLRVVVSSIEYTFEDVHRFCGRIVRTSSSAYRDVWKSIETFFMEESRNCLLDRLAYYRRFLEDLQLIFEDGLARLLRHLFRYLIRAQGTRGLGCIRRSSTSNRRSLRNPRVQNRGRLQQIVSWRRRSVFVSC